MWARMQLLKARIAAAQEAQMGGALAERSKQIASLQHQAEVVLEGGISAILAEFGAQDATVPGTPDP
jgi:preprotein translocase subunit YajC